MTTALITGASSGIGYELTRLFAADRYDLVLVARRQQTLEQLAEELREEYAIRVKVIAKDLAQPGIADEIFQEVRQESIRIDVLVNNAGFGTFGFFSEIDIASTLEMLHINMISLTHLTRLFLKEMLEQKSGRILNVASTAAFQAGPLMATYYASKSYVLLFSEALAEELRATGVTVTVLCPGPTFTGFQKRAYMETSKLVSGKVLPVMDARAVAKIGYQGLMKGKTIVIPGLLNRALAFSVRLTPRKLVTKISRALQEKRR